MVRGMANESRVKELKGKISFKSSNGFMLYTNNIDKTRIGNINMNDLFVGYTNNVEKIHGVTIPEIEQYMSFWFATGGINDFKSIKQILPVPEKALVMSINQYIERILSNKKRQELERTTYIPEAIGKNMQTIKPVNIDNEGYAKVA